MLVKFVIFASPTMRNTWRLGYKEINKIKNNYE